MVPDDFFNRHRPRTYSELIGNAELKRKSANLHRRGGAAKAIMLYGPMGCGKTTSALIEARTIVCRETSATQLDPCGECSGCRNALNFTGVSSNAATLTIDDLKNIERQAMWSSPYPLVYLIDELHRATERLQDMLVTMIEDGRKNYAFIFCTLKPAEVEAPLLQRLLSFEVRPPTTDEMVEHLLRVCSIEGWSQTQSDLQRIAQLNNNVPRACLNALLQSSL
jgi:DNA polymerase-3 subunit gamma/tau